MGTVTICQHRYIIPKFEDFRKKYYFLITSLLFEYNPSGYYEDRLEVIGFNEKESSLLCEIFSFFYQEDNALRIDDFDLSLLESMIGILSSEQQNLLIDHIVLSSIDGASDINTLSNNLKINITKLGTSFSFQYFSGLDYFNFFKGEDSSFINEYYPSKEEKDEILLQYSKK